MCSGCNGVPAHLVGPFAVTDSESVFARPWMTETGELGILDRWGLADLVLRPLESRQR